LADVD
jgi:hypothetical protein